MKTRSRIKSSKWNKPLSFLIFLPLLFSCAHYTTPGGPARLSELSDAGINELMSRQPAASFPANIVIARIQSSQYRNYGHSSYGVGRYSVVTSRDVESGSDFARLQALPQIESIAPVNRLILPQQLDDLLPLRNAAARLRADVLLIYTFDTSFHIGEQRFAPLNVIALGLLNNQEVSVSTTVSAAFYDVRTEFLYGLAEATTTRRKDSSIWRESTAVDELRILTEQTAFQALIPELESTWRTIVVQHATIPTYSPFEKLDPQKSMSF